VSEEKKERKPLLEALASVTDGLDVLVGLEKEKKEEKPEERKAPDTFGGLLQSMIPLLIIPQILPLFQQALGQTLQSTTVNVKVESSTALIPISIEATTVIMPIEIRASQVTLNVAIKQSDVTLKISIENSTVTLDVNITNNILNINIVGSQATLNINIVSSVTTLNVNITNTSINVNIVGSITLNVNVTNSVLAINIQTQSIDLKIYTPSGRWVSASDLLGTSLTPGAKYLYPSTETTFTSSTGRGRIKRIGFVVTNNDQSGDIRYDLYLRVYTDGVLRLNLAFITIDSLLGSNVSRLRDALVTALANNLPLPFNTARLLMSPERYLIMPFGRGATGGITYMVWDRTNSRVSEFGGYIDVDFEFTSSSSVRIYNSNTGSTFRADVAVIVGEYL
jgi:hypothetical protein